MRLLGTSAFFVAITAPMALAQSPQPKMGAPLAGLTAPELLRFDAGRTDFTHTFQPSEGLGPTFNQASCASCHNNPIGGSGSIEVTRFGFYDAKGVGWDPLASLGGSLLQLNTINLAIQEGLQALPTAQQQAIQSLQPTKESPLWLDAAKAIKLKLSTLALVAAALAATSPAAPVALPTLLLASAVDVETTLPGVLGGVWKVLRKIAEPFRMDGR